MNNYLHRVLPAVGLCLTIVSCSGQSQSPVPGGAAGPGGRGGRGAGGPVPVLTAQALRKPLPVTIPAVGTVESSVSVQVRAQVTGQLSAVHFSEGQEVRKDDPLFTLDQRPFRAAIQQAEALLARDSANLKNAQVQANRAQNLFERGIVAREQYDTSQATLAALAATVDADKAAIETAKVNLQYTEIKAPLDGRTGVLNAHVGDLVRVGDATPLVVINQLSPIYVTFSVPGRLLNEVRRFQAQRPLPVTAVAPTGASPQAMPAAAPAGGAFAPAAGDAAPSPVSGVTEQGMLAFIDNAVDPTTGTIRLKGTFPNRNRALWPGAFVQVTLHLSTQQNAVVVPAVAVQASQEGQYVYLVKPDQTVEMRPVTTERQQGDEVVVAQGLTGGETVVTDGHLRLTPGSRVSERGDGGGPRGERAAGGGRGGARGGGAEGGGRR